jgi:hypothetical protein
MSVCLSGWEDDSHGLGTVQYTRVKGYLSLQQRLSDGVSTLTVRPSTRLYQSQAQQEQALLHYWTSEVAPQTVLACDWLGTEAD